MQYIRLLVIACVGFALSLTAQPASRVEQTIAATPQSQAVATAVSARSEEQKRSYRTAMEQADQKIANEVKAHSELMKNLEYLCYRIGARLTGSAQMQAASQWTLQRFKDYGVDAHLETAQIAHGWTRGRDTAALIRPLPQAMKERNIEVRSAGWSKATPGEITANVIALPALKSAADFDPYKGKLKGAIVLSRPPSPPPNPNDPVDNAYDSVIPPQRGVTRQDGFDRLALLRMIAAEEPAALLQDSGKPDSLFNMTSFS